MITTIGEYQAKPIFIIKRDEVDKYPFSFGYAKAKMIVECIEEIKKFVEMCEAEKKEKNP